VVPTDSKVTSLAALKFGVMQGTAAASMLISTLSTPLLMNHFYPAY